MKSVSVILVRHGATGANVCKPHVLQGMHPDNDLIDLGRKQAAALARAVRRVSVTRVYSSPLKRALQTAQYLCDSLGVAPVVEEGFVEADVGVWAGMTWPAIQEHWPDEYRQFTQDAEQHGYLGGENMRQVRDRVWEVLRGLQDKHAGETIVVVAHGVVNRVVLADAMGLPLRYARQIPQENGAYNTIEIHERGVQVRTVNAKH